MQSQFSIDHFHFFFPPNVRSSRVLVSYPYTSPDPPTLSRTNARTHTQVGKRTHKQPRADKILDETKTPGLPVPPNGFQGRALPRQDT